MTITVLKPGLQATVQDMGRFGYQKQGVVVGGAMDVSAARAANVLVGNGEAEAVLELTWTGAQLRMEKEAIIAVCGADLMPEVDGEPVPMWRPVLVRAGAVLAFRGCRSGFRSYIALAGGIDLPPVMGSRSTYLRAGLGGYRGRMLQAGDKLEAKPFASGSLNGRLTAALLERRAPGGWHAEHFAIAERETAVVRAFPGAHYGRLTEEGKRMLFGGSFRIGHQSDRMGCRLEGERVAIRQEGELLSEAVSAGTIQLPPNGSPIVLLADRQTTGGYPRIAHVASVDIPMFAQLKPGAEVRFELITHREAESLLLASEKDFHMLRTAVALKFR
ncbi:biotin-dependent carboxyltransferase family protein [Paenibacillus sp. LHD-117]|uniref:5-oxoprolinase subunit C family protein n=1 Tax=Paenibacillus sp. LHD-117 TaxID=3071412 RepID=UPI0027E0D63E|nr:biotin-dependent carboxyltransferase family protein [Paenibacillus sp. LHD-117]MDQ6422556.1 biotin-dependent carboxyltransferase family protein [Paenibacillus sp. LHD-117]